MELGSESAYFYVLFALDRFVCLGTPLSRSLRRGWVRRSRSARA